MELLEIKNVTTGYGKKEVLHDVSLDVQESEIALLIGSNGSGKSTLLKVVYGQNPVWKNPDTGSHGSVRFLNEDISGFPPYQLLPKGLVYVPQKNNVFEDMTVKENLEVGGLTIRDKKQLKDRIEQVYTQFPALKEFRNRTPFKMSGGERQMLAIAMGLIHQPKMMLLDEPCSGLAPSLVHNVLQKIKQLNEELGITFLIVEHRVKESLTIADKVFALKLGRLYKEYRNHEAFEVGELREVFV